MKNDLVTLEPAVAPDRSPGEPTIPACALTSLLFIPHQLEPGTGFEPATCCLQNSCSTTELSRLKLVRDSTTELRWHICSY